MIKSCSLTSPVSIREWAYQKSTLKSIPEWNELITIIDNADLLLTLASDQKCPQRATILKCLYSLVGSSASKHIDMEIVKIKALLDKAQSSPDIIILNWVKRSRMILDDLRKFDYTQWCLGGFSEKDLPSVQ